MSEEEQVYFIVESPVTEEVIPIPGERDGSRDTGGGWGRRSRVDAMAQANRSQRVGVKKDQLKSQMQALVATVNDLFDTTQQQAVSQSAHGLQLDEITLSVQVNGKGELSIMGTGGEISGSGGITLKFVRPK
jgi:hypothetical protein